MKEQTMKEKMLRGSAWMTAGSIISRILGALYIIPWYSWFGSDKLQANALYTKGYTVYSIFLMIAISGIPSAVAKQVAHYNSKNEYGVSKRLFKTSLVALFILGAVCTLVFWLIAPWISQGDPRMVSIYRSLALALLIIPSMSLLRGYFQGFQDMAPSALSQLIEQFLRIIYMLLATYITIKVMGLPFEAGVWQSTFAAFIGAVGGTLLLVGYYLKHKKRLDKLVSQSNDQLKITNATLLKEVLYQALPFIFIACAMSMFNLVDQFTFPVIMQQAGAYSMAQINALYALFAGNTNKLIMIVVALSTAMATTAIPLLSEAVAKCDSTLMKKQLLESLELLFFVMLPAVFGMAAVSRPLYLVFYGYEATGIFVLAISAYVALAMGLFNVLGSLLQGIYENKQAIKYTAWGLGLKLVLQYPLTLWLGVFGPLLATGIAMSWASYLMLRFLYLKYNLPTGQLQVNVNKMFMVALLMFGVTLLFVGGYYMIFPGNSRWSALVSLSLAAGVGGYLYLLACFKLGLVQRILGTKVTSKLQKIFRWK
ncbi:MULTISPECIES: putative polysaccharide biosynthesis protein [Ligilactobacillus]|uniref:Stage V sporulation protein B n=1 Tax=Ligilactobacillus animalis TaxID=1605 RepID=A0ABR4RME2_9LACO|nr:polysaccharide biosynthesis protein [Ligilactobacillus animalis]KDA45258.1 stage V sporulation protein B [Ligilactobacillus animalis]MBU5279122.1 polysaccharide biosynthesis protein [Ligilactobacillus animalis]MDO5884266.1 polysaccharide biosynthesis protein [Ligilactobacillus animalis]MDU8987249.1 polysaccharide biosynthesis protein [Ligilactobacillus animalis]MEE0261985.1 polysaccharide biosynthesis protein [Ligilactobacillus animalis]